MLTKALLKYSVRKKKVYPKFIDPKNQSLNDSASKLINLYESSVGKSLSTLEESVSPHVQGAASISSGLNKLLTEKISLSLKIDQDTLSAYRHKTVLEAQKLRAEKVFPSLEAFYETLESRLGEKREETQSKLYSDLPECQEVQAFKKTKATNLLEHYNVSQVQGLLINATKLTVSINSDSLSFKRALFRSLKFHRLLCQVIKDDRTGFSFELSGPLSIFNQRQTYGLRLANFFPYILHASSWNIEADLVLKSNNVTLSLDHSSHLKSHYSLSESYLPKELLSFIESFNKKESTWQASSSSQFLNMGEKSYCFPDIELKRNSKSTVYLELFHKWHYGQLKTRLNCLEKKKDFPLILGVCKQLKEKKEFQDMALGDFAKTRIFYFSDFPTAGKLKTYLEQQLEGLPV